MLTIKEIFQKFEKMHSYSFSTISDDLYPEIRIAHFLTYDEEGLYFQTMNVKPFYKQLKDRKKLGVCSLYSNATQVEKDEDGLSYFPPGFYIRVSGDVRELSFAEIKQKSEEDFEKFNPLLLDISRYPTMTTFVMYKFRGEVYDYDFEKTTRDNKIFRSRFSFNGLKFDNPGFNINQEKCISCGICAKVCTFDAIVKGKKYSINGNKCDECGSCYTACPVNAITAKSPLSELKRREIGKKVIAYQMNNS